MTKKERGEGRDEIGGAGDRSREDSTKMGLPS